MPAPDSRDDTSIQLGPSLNHVQAGVPSGPDPAEASAQGLGWVKLPGYPIWPVGMSEQG